MILDFIILVVSILFLAIAWNWVYGVYKEREWRKNNPDEFNWDKKKHKNMHE